MATEETEYKSRIARLMKGIAAKASFSYWATALGAGAVAGIPDKWFQFGHIPIFFELKRKSAKARKLQEHRLKKLREMGFIAFCESANPDSTGVKGQERQDVYRQILEQLSKEKVDEFVLQYTCDAKKLRKYLEEQLNP